jgi:integrase
LLRAFRLGSKAEPPQVNRIPKIEMLPEDNVRTGVLEHEKYVTLRDSLPSHYRLLLVIAYHTGARLGELLKIQWPQVNFRNAEIRFDAWQTKTKKVRVLPIYGEMTRSLQEAARYADATYPNCPWVFQIGGDEMIFNWRTWRSLCDAAKIPHLHFHDLRRTALTNMIAAGIPEKVAMEVSGHRTRKTFERYHIVSDRNIREVGQKMEEYLAGTTTGTKPPGKGGKVIEMKKMAGGS